ncbi:MAG: alpha/beta hydrolase [Pirellulales bacterium]|jgi:pimeloyl-ACP methyl ester carboxylesterase|nr:alpha/beta hydrolase [Pirellulales bacterium]
MRTTDTGRRPGVRACDIGRPSRAVRLLAWAAVAAGLGCTAAVFHTTRSEEPRVAEQEHGEGEIEGQETADEEGLLNLRLPTFGGKQFWTDHCWRNGWRVQQNAVTSHWRLLDPNNIRYCWGSRKACERMLSEQAGTLAEKPPHHVVLLHGLFRSSGSMQALGELLEEQKPWRSVCFEYASTRASITEHAAAFREVIDGLPPNATLSFVGHSMGNIVVRHALGDWEAAGDHATISRVKSVVMLGPPNNGAAIARQLSKVPPYEWIAGKGGVELGAEWEAFEAKLATPTCPFGIIAGRLPDVVYNPLVGDVGDFVVSVDETKLPGAAFLEVSQGHSFLMDDAAVQEAVVNFIDHERFTE